jgi:hypothetical protein
VSSLWRLTGRAFETFAMLDAGLDAVLEEVPDGIRVALMDWR